jgi:hydrogenase large subunit
MTTTQPGASGTETSDTGLTEMAWDPITRIVGSLGIYTKIDFKQKTVAECHSTSSVFRGYSIFMKGKDPRDAHFITSRICGICGDNHATCSVYNQNMAYGVQPPHLGEWIINLGEAAEYMFDHNIFQENLVGVDYCERMVKETNPGVLDLAERTEAPHAGDHGYRTIADIMRALNPLEGDFYREALQMSRLTREMFCLMEGRHVHPSTLYPGGVGTVATVQLFTDYLTRLMRYCDFMKRVVPLHDDLFDFFYEALPGYEEVGRRRVLLGCWGSLNDPEACDFKYEHMSDWGRKMFVTPGVIVDGQLITNDLVDINLGMRILLGSSYYDDWSNEEMFVNRDPLGNPVDRNHPWNQTTIPHPQKRDFNDKYSWTMSPRWFDGTDHLALDTGGGPIARLWSTALSGLVDIGGYVRATGHSVVINLPRTMNKPEATYEWKIPQWSNAIERNRARTYFQAYCAAAALHFVEQALIEVRGGRTETWTPFKVPQDGVSVGFTEAVRGVLSHHMVIRDGKIANYHPYPPTPWNGSVRDVYGTPGPYEDAVQNTPIFEENPPENFKGIDIMRAVRSFDPCLPCGVHMYLGEGKTLQRIHTPTAFGGDGG